MSINQLVMAASPESEDNVEKLRCLVETQRRILQSSLKLKGQKLVSRPSRSERISTFMLENGVCQNHDQQVVTQISIISRMYPPSVVRIRDLEKIYIGDLLLETNHRGRYILLRAVTPGAGVSAIVEDELGVVERLEMYHHFNDFGEKGLNDFFSEGQIVLVKEPYYKLGMDGNPCIRIDHMSDLIFLEQNVQIEEFILSDVEDGIGNQARTGVEIPSQWRTEEVDTTPGEWKEKGDEFLEKGKYYMAISCYSKGIWSAETSDGQCELLIALRLQRAQCYLLLQFYERVLKETTFILSMDSHNKTALLHHCHALYSLSQFQECLEYLKTLLRQCSDDRDARYLLRLTQVRLAEKRGVYDFQKLRRLVLEKGIDAATQMDIGNYKSTAIEVGDTPNMGRALLATRDIFPGELLIVEKAWAVCFTAKHGCTYLVNLQTEQSTFGTQDLVTKMSIVKLWKNPEQGRKQLLPLWSGGYRRVEEKEEHAVVDGRPTVDRFFVDRIQTLNSFACEVLSMHGFTTETETRNDALASTDADHDCGIWITPAYINHACMDGNCVRSFIGDVMIVRASRYIPKGEQLLFGYVNTLEVLNSLKDPLATRQEMFINGWGFRCRCTTCVAEGKVMKVIRLRRKQVYKKIEKLAIDINMQKSSFSYVSDPNSEIFRKREAQLMRVLSILECLYPASRPPQKFPRFELAMAMDTVYNMYLRLQKLEQVDIMARRMLQALGWVVKYPTESEKRVYVEKWGVVYQFVVGAWVSMWWNCSLRLGVQGSWGPSASKQIAESYREVARRSHVIWTGSEVGFEEIEVRLEKLLVKVQTTQA